MADDVRAMSDEEIIERVIARGFRGDHALYQRFCSRLQAGLPPGTEVALRGSVVTDESWEEGEPFDADGPGTSDLDVALVGDEVIRLFDEDAFYVPRLNSEPLSDESPEVAPALDGLRRELEAMVGRPVNFQAINELMLKARDTVLRQPYVTIVCSDPDG